jgi:YD repeat-containing protein
MTRDIKITHLRFLPILFASVLFLALCGNAGASTTTYTYDSLGRVVTASFPNGTMATYTYDPAGNRTAYVVTATALPVTHNVSATVIVNSSNNPIPLNITGGSPSSVAVSTLPAHGSASANSLSISYTPASGYLGADSFAYTASNGAGTSAPATASISVQQAFTASFSPTLNCPSGAPTYVCATNDAASYTFASVTVSVTGGSGSFTYSWTPASTSGGTWASGTAATFTPIVSGVASSTTAQATYTCTVTDTVTGAHATSNAVLYQYTFGGGACGPAGCG